MPSDDSVVFRELSFRFDSASDPLLADLNIHFRPGFTGVVGANGSGKTTLLRLAVGELQPQQGSVQRPSTAIYCPQRTDHAPPELARLLDEYDAEAYELRGRLGIEDEIVYR